MGQWRIRPWPRDWCQYSSLTYYGHGWCLVGFTMGLVRLSRCAVEGFLCRNLHTLNWAWNTKCPGTMEVFSASYIAVRRKISGFGWLSTGAYDGCDDNIPKMYGIFLNCALVNELISGTRRKKAIVTFNRARRLISSKHSISSQFHCQIWIKFKVTGRNNALNKNVSKSIFSTMKRNQKINTCHHPKLAA